MTLTAPIPSLSNFETITMVFRTQSQAMHCELDSTGIEGAGKPPTRRVEVQVNDSVLKKVRVHPQTRLTAECNGVVLRTTVRELSEDPFTYSVNGMPYGNSWNIYDRNFEPFRRSDSPIPPRFIKVAEETNSFDIQKVAAFLCIK